MLIKVFKFGGASVKDADGFRQVGNIIDLYRDDKLVIVVSALGKTTNALEAWLNHLSEGTEISENTFIGIKEIHYSIIQNLFESNSESLKIVSAEIDRLLEEMRQKAEEIHNEDYDYIYDQIVSYGELLSSTLLSHYLTSLNLDNIWCDIRNSIRTDTTYREARINWEVTQNQVDSQLKPLLKNNNRLVTQGFIGRTDMHNTTTLGREGSDYTAAILSYCLDAMSMHIWKDVPGVLTGDPRLFNDVMMLPRLSYKEAIEMTYYGAKVIHPKTIKPIQNKQIPLYVRPFSDPASNGTLISDEKELTYPPIVVIEPVQALLHISANDFSFVAEHHLSRIFTLLASCRLKVNMMRNTAISFSVCVNQIDDRITRFESELGGEFKLITDRDLELITIMHYNEDILTDMKKDKLMLFEEKLPEIVQLVVRSLPKMTRKES
ncbi:MAG TPA: aspartate kinase [Saprospiraceae bacterium]|nr:aspartate kinase [Saprospiraceae bacterium]HRO09159.1 aspartate kinase [Saprospiraceae bacterium]HRO73495.1 aspartate kinase [Saprospiraceae bacterium]HRP42633.1 aspartate kinase [Saprospiraceae bacterium]